MKPTVTKAARLTAILAAVVPGVASAQGTSGEGPTSKAPSVSRFAAATSPGGGGIFPIRSNPEPP